MKRLIILILLASAAAYAQCPAAMSTLTASANLSGNVDSKVCGLSGAGVPTASWCTTALIGKATYTNTTPIPPDYYVCTANLTWTLKGTTGSQTTCSATAVAAYSGTDLVIDGTTNAKVTSAGHTFVAADQYKRISITAGTGFTIQTLYIASVSAGAATLSASAGTLGSTGGTYSVAAQQVCTHNLGTTSTLSSWKDSNGYILSGTTSPTALVDDISINANVEVYTFSTTLTGVGVISTGGVGATGTAGTNGTNGATGPQGPAGSVALIASGAKTLNTTAVASATCGTVQTDTATGAATTDAVIVSFNADPTAVTGYIPLTTGMLTVIPYPTTNTANFKVCNNTGSSITPGAVTLNWRIVR